MFGASFFFLLQSLHVMRHYMLIKCIQIKKIMKKACGQCYNYSMSGRAACLLLNLLFFLNHSSGNVFCQLIFFISVFAMSDMFFS